MSEEAFEGAFEAARRAVVEAPGEREPWLRLARLAARFGRELPRDLLIQRIDDALGAMALGAEDAGPLAAGVEAWADQALRAYLNPRGGELEGPEAKRFRRRLGRLPGAMRARLLRGPYLREPLVLGWDEVLPSERIYARIRDGRLTDLLQRVVRDADVAEAVLEVGFLHTWDLPDFLAALARRMPQRRFVGALERVAPRDPRRARRLGDRVVLGRLESLNFPHELRTALRALGRAGDQS